MAEVDDGDKENQPVIEIAETERIAENLSGSAQAETSRSQNQNSVSVDKILSKDSEEFETTKKDDRSLKILDEEVDFKGQPREGNGATVETGKVTDEPKESSKNQEPESAKETKPSNVDSLQQSKSLEPLSEDRKAEYLGRSHRHCQRRFREMIFKRELRKEELGKLEGDLRSRLDMLECSMPAVMVWNVWRMAQSGMPVTSLHRTIQKQFQLHLDTKRTSSENRTDAGTEASRHYDSRVRELEAERKVAQKRADEARAIWTEKQAALEAKRRKLEEAKKIQQGVKERIEQLDEQAKKLRSEAQKRHEEDQECTAGECGDVKCRERWLRRVTSSSSIGSTDLECLEKLQELAEAELSLKKQIAELERREESYMRALQQADELWTKHEGDTTSAVGELQGQLSTKLSANQELADRVCQLEDELEIVRKKLTACKAALAKYTDVKWIDREVGHEDDFAAVTEKSTMAQRKTADQKTGKDDGVAEIMSSDQGVLAAPRMRNAETTRERIDTFDVGTSQDQVDSTDAAVDRQTDLIDTEDKTTAVNPEDISDVERQVKLRETEERKRELRKYLSMLGSLSELYKDDDYGVCAPDFPCNDNMVLSSNEVEIELDEIQADVDQMSDTFEQKSPLVRVSDKSIPLASDEELPLAKVPGDINLVAKSIQPTPRRRSFALDTSIDAIPQDKSIPPVSGESIPREVPIDTADKPTVPISERRSAPREVPAGDKLIEGVSEAKEITAEAEIQTVPKMVDQLVGGQGADDVAEVDKEAALKHLAHEERGKEVVRDVIAAETQHANELAEIVDSMRTVKSKEVEVGADDAVLPLNELRSWFDDVIVIREVISKCRSCKGLKEKADKLAERIAVYGTIDITEIPEITFEEETEEENVDDEADATERRETEIEIKDAEMKEMGTSAVEEMETKEAEQIEDLKEKEEQLIEEDTLQDNSVAEERKDVEKYSEDLEERKDHEEKKDVEKYGKDLEETSISKSFLPKEPEVVRKDLEDRREDELSGAEPESQKMIDVKDEEGVSAEVVKEKEMAEEKEPPDVIEEQNVEEIQEPLSKETPIRDELPVPEDLLPKREEPEEQEQIKVITKELEFETVKKTEILDKESISTENETQFLPTPEDQSKKEEDQPEVKLLPTKKGEEPEDGPAPRKKEEEPEEKMSEEEKLEELSAAEEEERPGTIKEKLFVAVESVISSAVDVKVSVAEDPERFAVRGIRAIDPRSVARPYLAVAEIEEREKDPAVLPTWKKDPCVCKSLAQPTPARATRAEQIETIRAITTQETQTGPIRIICRRLDHPKSKVGAESALGGEGITIEKLKWRRRMKDGVLTTSTEIQTDIPKAARNEVKTRIDETFRTRVGPTSRFLLIPEQEIKSHSYEKKHQPVEEKHKDKCTCCMCSNEMVSSTGFGITKLSSSETISITRKNLPAPLLMLREMVEQTTAKVEKLTHEDRKMNKRKTPVMDQSRIFKDAADIGEICSCTPEISPSTSSSLPTRVYRKRTFAEKRDISCSTKIPKVKASRTSKSSSDSLPKYTAKVISRGPVKEILTENSSSSDCYCSEKESSSLRRISSKKTRDCLCGD